MRGGGLGCCAGPGRRPPAGSPRSPPVISASVAWLLLLPLLRGMTNPFMLSSNHVWQEAGATLSLKTALAEYRLKEFDLREVKL